DQLLKQIVDLVQVQVVEADEFRAHVVVFYVRHQQPQRRVHAGGERNQNRRNAQVERHAPGVHRPAAAEGDQGKIADVVAARRGNRLDRFFHLHVDDLQHAVGGFEQVELERPGDFFFQQLFRLRLVELHPAAEEMVGIEHAGDDVGVGDGDIFAAAVVADRAGVGAGAIGADLQAADRVDARDGAAAGADRVDIEHRQRDRPHVDFAL